MSALTVLHNPKCSTSRSLLELLKAESIDFEVFDLLDTPISPEFLAEVCDRLELDPSDLVRTEDAVWKERFASLDLDEDEILMALIEEPRMIQRPIALSPKGAVIARPIERVRELL
jgi:arsenate reductase